MALAVMGLAGKGTFDHGVHPPERKGLAADAKIEVLPTPAMVKISLLQHVGAPCEAATKPRQEVAMGEMIGQSEAFISAPVHASIAGLAQLPGAVTLPNGRHVKAVGIKADGQQLAGDALYADVLGGDWPVSGLEQYAPGDIVAAVKQAGVVGQGGAAFPTYVKLTKNEAKPIDTILVNGCECEPYLTADYRLMVEAPEPVVTGALLAARACGASNVVIAIEDNKPLAVDTISKAARGTDVQVAELKTKYPQGGEKQTVQAALGKTIPGGGLPLDVGVVVINVGTAAAVARAVLRGKALTHRVITVTGDGVAKPKNILAPIGVSYGELIDYCGGLNADAVRVIAGGPMMGFTLGDLAAPVTKGTSGITVLTDNDVARITETNCVRCGRCVDVCPMNLVPTRIALASRNNDWALAKKYHITSCVECGCCAYTCPAGIPLVQLIRMGKAQLPRD
ncbi:MAG: electron transport complex subunit RsxC [Phycisphaerae bacterium]|nr:electron transport complex subunit RsxC [Phycisphaerae bacterium]